ncbi:MAG: hypothetical protein A2018_04490 [Alphaproteobacteria bacterium GWF2_58_20]|nr:MAG: hypothetical protein A2018_04490 [Alphaproteobacteria bacterium GWF2_58_20]
MIKGFVRKFLPKTLLWRTLIIMIMPVVAVQVISVYIFFGRHWDVMVSRLAYAVAGEVSTLVADVETSQPGDYPERRFLQAARAFDLIASFRAGESLSEARQEKIGIPIVEEKLSWAMAEKVQKPFRVSVYIPDEVFEVDVAVEGGVLKVLVPKKRLFSSTGYIFIWWMMFSSVLFSAIAIVFMKNQVRPIRRLAEVAEDFGKGRESKRFKPAGALEVRRASAAFLVMRERIRRQMAQRTALLAGVSHDLRTPLTRMKLELAMLEDEKAKAGIASDIDEMEHMIGGYLSFARGEGNEASEITDLSVLVSEVVSDHRRLGGDIALETEEGISLPLRSGKIRRCLGNLLSNTGKYASHAWVSVRRDGGMAFVVVDDDGPGIGEDAREKVFQPFWRLGENDRGDEGVGLGLTIARDIARSHGGDISLTHSPRGGLRVLLRLPL